VRIGPYNAAPILSALIVQVGHADDDRLGVVGDGWVAPRVRQVVVAADQQLVPLVGLPTAPRPSCSAGSEGSDRDPPDRRPVVVEVGSDF